MQQAVDDPTRAPGLGEPVRLERRLPANGMKTLLEALQASALALRTADDGSLEATAETLELRSLSLKTPAAGVDLQALTFADAALRFDFGAPDGSLRLRSLAAAEVRIEEAQISPSGGSGAIAGARLEPLGTVQGRLQACIRDARWVIDAEITAPVVAGRIDFDRVVVEHVGPNSAMGLAPGGVYVEAPSRERTEVVRFAARDIPGARYEQRGGFAGLGVTDRGSLDLRAFVEAALAGGTLAPLWQPPGREVQGLLERTRLAGDLQLADGALGTARQHVVLAGRAQGRNGIALNAAVLGRRLVVRWPELAASGAAFAPGGRDARTGAIEGSVDINVTGLSGPSPRATVTVHRMTIRDLALGEDSTPPSTKT